MNFPNKYFAVVHQ